MGMQLGRSAVQAGQEYVERNFGTFVPISLLKHHFNVSNLTSYGNYGSFSSLGDIDLGHEKSEDQKSTDKPKGGRHLEMISTVLISTSPQWHL